MPQKNERFLNDLCRIAQKAGAAILEVVRQDIEITRKDDASPVTQADMAAHHIIWEGLSELTPHLPIISEEHDEQILPEGATRFWLVDPLDGTKSFIRGTGEYTVNIGLIEDGIPTVGVIYIPVEKMCYWGALGMGAWRCRDGAVPERISTREVPDDGLAAVVSHSHLDQKTAAFLEQFTITSRVSAASSLKFCRVAEGLADIYPRFGPTMEWDIAAGHAIVSAAGGRVEQPDGGAIPYGKAGFKNGAFVVWGN